MTDFRPNPIEKPGAVGSEAIEALTKIVAGIKETGEAYVITCGEMLELGLFDEVEVMGWTMVEVSRDLKAVLDHCGCYCSGPYLGHPEVGADD
ncbi:MAG: hypothetical protein DI537_31120 [Stutzerimonas stutzeri]|nr:MAG: hypothetical protein DI537_31120 [Stutzerimonas stutzeri]